MGSFTDYRNDHMMDLSRYDENLTPHISIWMKGRIGHGESGLHYRNDGLFAIYHYLAGLSQFSRDKHDDSTVTGTRSDRADQYEGVTVVRVEEKEDSLQEAVNDLVSKSCWLPHYARLPFIFGIAVTKTELSIYALKAMSQSQIFSVQLHDMASRWLCVVAMINIARTLKHFIERNMIFRSLAFNKWHDRNNKRIRLEERFVQIEYRDQQTFQRMVDFYKVTSGVPHLEQMSEVSSRHYRISLTPVGVHRLPFDLSELFHAIRDITLCIFSLHDCGYVHCDVRWSNIITFNNQWFLIDCEYVCRLDDEGGLRSRSSIMKRKYVRDNSKPWDSSFDMYQIALLFEDCGLEYRNHHELESLYSLLKLENPSLDEIRALMALSP